MATPYRTAAPRPQEPLPPPVPFEDRYPKLYSSLKVSGTFTAGLVCASAMVTVLWFLGLGMRYITDTGPSDTTPNVLIGITGFLALVVVGMLGMGVYMLGQVIVRKFFSKDSRY